MVRQKTNYICNMIFVVVPMFKEDPGKKNGKKRAITGNHNLLNRL